MINAPLPDPTTTRDRVVLTTLCVLVVFECLILLVSLIWL